jgi:poly-beta-1,6-N-acetyl-D-glucosamine synthase
MAQDQSLPSYVLITPARNEEEFIEKTLESVTRQTYLPLKWVIVNDGSTDGTASRIDPYLSKYDWIELVNLPVRRERNFAAKVHAFNAGQEKVKNLNYEIIGNLDADVSFDPGYFEFLMTHLAENPKLGVAGTAFLEGNLSYNYELVGVEHVSGMIQMFRRECFEAIGGYSAVKTGGIDLMAVLSARTKGWETRTFTETTFMHHRSQGGALHTGLRGRWYMGRKDYLLGNHPVWELFRSLYQMQYKPYVVGGLLVLVSYFWHSIRGVERTMPRELMELRQSDQMKRLKSLVARRLHLTATII